MKKVLLTFIVLVTYYNIVNSQTVYFNDSISLYGITNEIGVDILKPKYTKMRQFHNGYSKFQQDGKWGLINEKGIVAIKPEFINEYDISDPNEDLVAVSKNSKWGYMDLKGNLVIGYLYDDTKIFCNGVAWVMQDKEFNKINKQGKLLSDIWSKELDVTYGFCDNNPKKTSLVKFQNNSNSYTSDGLYGFKNTLGNVIIIPQYVFASDFSSGLAFVQTKKNNVNYFIDEKNNTVFELKSNWQASGDGYLLFINGLFEVEITEADEKYFALINTKGNIIKKMNTSVR